MHKGLPCVGENAVHSHVGTKCADGDKIASWLGCALTSLPYKGRGKAERHVHAQITCSHAKTHSVLLAALDGHRAPRFTHDTRILRQATFPQLEVASPGLLDSCRCSWQEAKGATQS